MYTEALIVLLAAIFAVEGRSEDGRCVVHLQGLGAVKLDLEKPVNLSGALLECNQRDLYVLRTFHKLNDKEKALCGYQLVPYLTENMTEPMAVVLTSGRVQVVSESFEFNCVLCQQNTLGLSHLIEHRCDDLTSSSYFKVHLIRADSELRDNVTEEAKDELLRELDVLLKPVNWSAIELHEVRLDESQRLHFEYRVFTPVSTSVVTGDVETSVMNDTFLMRVEDVGFCPEDQMVGDDGAVIHWPRKDLSFYGVVFQFVTNASTGVITRRSCIFNSIDFIGVWEAELTRWELVWEPCSLDDQFFNEARYVQFLNSSDIESRHAQEFHAFTAVPVNTTTFQDVARLVEREVIAYNALSERTVRELAVIATKLKLDSNFFVALEPRASLVVADLGGSAPAEGFTLDINSKLWDAVDNITINRKPTMEGRAPFALDVSARLLEAHTLVTFVVIWKFIATSTPEVSKIPRDQYLEVAVIFPRRWEVSAWSFASYGNHYVDITYDKEVMSYHPSGTFILNSVACVAWNNDLRDWSSEGCKMLYVGKGNFSACRCSGKYFAMKDGVPIARFALKKGWAFDSLTVRNNPLTDFLKDKPGLMTAFAIECLLSGLGLGSIYGTAIFFKQWRENTGHKILLHMVLALTCNLVLGFTVSFVHMKTESVGCLVYGVLRHYSFLAMFLWMLVLSCLQLKRLTTVAGAKATTHLILKVATFAWGVPLVPIIILLSCNPGFYQTDRFDRGYCYPEGIVFQVTVQGPAGCILFVNACIFVKIVMHIFECRGEKKITRHSKNQKAEQLNKLKTSIFIFFLFGFTWVFHIFSEERVIVSDFLFEYLFLMTATTHIFALSVFFVFLQDATRKEWVTFINNLSWLE